MRRTRDNRITKDNPLSEPSAYAPHLALAQQLRMVPVSLLQPPSTPQILRYAGGYTLST